MNDFQAPGMVVAKERLEWPLVAFKVPGVVVAKERPRAGKNGIFFTPSKTRNYEKLVSLYACEAMLNSRKTMLSDAVRVDIIISHKIPKSFNKKKAQDALMLRIWPKKKDVDNCAKCILDGMNGIVYVSDSQVVELKIFKSYGSDDFAWVKVSEISVDQVC